MKQLGIFIFDEVEVLDFAGPFEVFESIIEIVPSGFPKPELKFVQSDGKIWTAARISAGIDLALHLSEKTYGRNLDLKTAK